MGAFANIPDSTRRPFGRRGLRSLLSGIVLIGLMSAVPIFAESETDATESDRRIEPNRSVSTSPMLALFKPDSSRSHLPAAPSTDGPPLTRAAAQLRIDEMSPVRWLSRFGSVSIGQRD